LTSLRLSRAERSSGEKNTHWREDLKIGLRFVMHNEALRSLTLLAFASAFFGTQLLTFLPVFAEKIFGTGAGGFSTLLSTSGAGAVAGALLIAATGDAIKSKGRAVMILQMAFGVLIIAFAKNPLVWIAYPLIFCAGAAMMMLFALINSLVQMNAHDSMRGRVVSIYMVAFRGAMPLGALITGWLAQHYSISAVITVEGALLSLLGAGFLLSPTTVKDH
jgi:predicted MFS family arabinose efflux permease